MAKKGLLRDSNNIEILPITRGELILDSSGNQALHSTEFLATSSEPGLMSPEDKTKITNLKEAIIDSELSTTSENPVQNKILTQIINSIRESYLKSASVSGNTLTIKDQSNTEIEFYNTTYGVVSQTTTGLAPSIGTEASETIAKQADEWVLTSTKGGAPTWRLLPINAFKNDNSNTTYTFTSGNGGFTVTPSGGSDQFVSIGYIDGKYINKLTDYSKAESRSSIETTDTLNSALGKLEYKADLGVTAYDLVNAAHNGDGTIENLKEILKVLEGISDTDTIQAIIGKYLPLSGGTIDGILKVNSNFYTNNIYFNREGVEQVLVPYAEYNYDLSYYDGSTWERVLTSKNYSSYALPLSGGKMLGSIKFQSSSLPYKTLQFVCGIDAFDDGGEMGWMSSDVFVNQYAPTKTGTGASGTWEINISGNAANSDKLGEKSPESYGQWLNNGLYGQDLNTVRNGFRAGKIYQATNAPSDGGYRGFLEYGYEGYIAQINSDSLNNLYYRWCENSVWKAWREFAFTDSNVASATKLQTARTIWGQSFDGTGNVSGDITLYNAIGAFFSDKWADSNGNTHPWYGLDFTHVSTGVTLSSYFGLTFKVGEGAMTINSYGNVGIGTASPDAKLDVVGGRIKCNYSIFGGRYNTNSNAAAFIWDKPGNYFTGVGSDGTTDTIRFSACNADGTWGSYSQNWKFYGNILTTGNVTAPQYYINTYIFDHPSPLSQCLVINSSTPQNGVSLSLKNSPGIGFHISQICWASLVYNGRFNFINAGADGYVSVAASSFIKNGSDDNYILLGGGGHKAVSDFATSGHTHDGRYLRWSNSSADTNAMNWGTLTAANGYSVLSHASSSDGGDMGWVYKNGQISYQIDGFFYQNEGSYRCLDTSDIESFARWYGDASTDSTISDVTSTSTADFLAKIHATSGLFNSRFGAMRGSWYYVGNTQLDTGVGMLEMAGTAVLNIGSFDGTNDTYKSLLFLDQSGRLWSYTANSSYIKQWSRYVKTTDKIENASYADSSGNADKLDGYHHDSFAKIASANNLIHAGNEFTFVPSGFGGSVWFNFRTTGDLNGAISEYVFGNGAGSSLATISNGQFSGNAATASYAYYLRGRDTNGGYYDSSPGNNIIAEWNTKSDNRWYLKAASTYECRVDYATTAANVNYINYTSRVGKGNGIAQFAQYDGATDNPTNDWYSHIIMHHANSYGYYTEIAVCFHSDNVYFRRQHAGTTTDWKRFALTSDIPTKTSQLTNDSGFITGYSNYYHTPSYSSGLSIATGTGISNLYVPYATASQTGVVSTAAQTFAGAKTFTGAMTVNNTITFGASNSYGIRTITNGLGNIGESGKRFYQCYVQRSYSTNGFYEDSDERLKIIIKPVKVILDDLSKLRKIYYIWKNPKDDQSLQLGMIAQDVQKLYPELVDVDEKTGYLSLAYDRLSVIALEAIDTLYQDYKKLKERVDKLEKLLINKGIS